MQSSSSRNPIALRIHKVLSTDFSNASTQQVLGTLSELYARPGTSDSPATKNPLDDPDDLFEEEDDNLPSTVVNFTARNPESVPGEVVALASKNLQRDVEGKLAQGSLQFLTAFGEVDKVCRFVQHIHIIING